MISTKTDKFTEMQQEKCTTSTCIGPPIPHFVLKCLKAMPFMFAARIILNF